MKKSIISSELTPSEKEGHKLNHLLKAMDLARSTYYFEIVFYDLSLSPNMEQIRRMFDHSYSKFPSLNGLIFHSDQGWQYQHLYFRESLKEHGIIQTMSRKDNCYDNCIMVTL